jgi:hypothetical protein
MRMCESSVKTFSYILPICLLPLSRGNDLIRGRSQDPHGGGGGCNVR